MTATMKKPKRASGSGISIPYGELKAALGIVSGAVAARGPRPVLANVLFQDGTLTATDLEMRIVTPIPYDGPPMLLPHDRLTQIVNAAGSVDEVEISVEGITATIRAGNGSWRLPTEDAMEFPSRANQKAKPIARMPADQFRELVGTVRFATDNQSSRYALGAVLLEYERPADRESNYGTLSFVATDGRRLAIAQCEIANDCDGSTTLAPRGAIDTLVRLAAGAEEIQLDATVSELVAEVDGTTVYARLIEGKFPRWRDVDTHHDTTPSQVVVGNLLHACSMAAVCTSDDSKGTTWAFSDAGLWISGQSAINGESSATCDLVQAGHKTTVKLDPVFVIEWLRTLDAAETIAVEAKDSDSAVVFRAGNCRQVVMPMAKDA